MWTISHIKFYWQPVRFFVDDTSPKIDLCFFLKKGMPWIEISVSWHAFSYWFQSSEIETSNVRTFRGGGRTPWSCWDYRSIIFRKSLFLHLYQWFLKKKIAYKQCCCVETSVNFFNKNVNRRNFLKIVNLHSNQTHWRSV